MRLPETEPSERIIYLDPGFFGKAADCACGHPLEDRKHLIFDCSQWDNIRKKFFPPNFKSSSSDLLIFNNKSRNGLREIMKHKLQTLLSSLENEELQT
ncbi:hypothetical protein CDAR_307741 [Caerostris darwini]|uniref:Reverse transcriptase zinc-binding domain-containing protein n=1 Tax=Caerostris darwini TaxID=1538125 RepID=A0AAV4WHA8_9ARAC|nr:hypothetical protein CDAR_307741 [Caerostris darwini]